MNCHAGHFIVDRCSFLFVLWVPCLSPGLIPSILSTALNKHLEPRKDYGESINCPKLNKLDKKCINLRINFFRKGFKSLFEFCLL